MARLDRLGPAKDVAQIGAAIGREFSHELIGAIARKPKEDLETALRRLIEAGLLFGQGVPPHVTYLFKHALIRDAAYSTLLRTRRQELHRHIVSVLGEDFSELVLTQPETLAHHCAESGMLIEAIEYYLLAAKRATGPYNAAKFANIAVAETLAAELAGSSIGVTILCIGNVQTRIPDSARNRSERYGSATETSPEAYEQLATFVRLGQSPDEVAEKAVRGIIENALLVFTHPEFRSYVGERFLRILAACTSP